MGKIRAPYYRIVVADARTKRDGRVIEEIGKYHPTENPSFIEVKSDRAQYWLSVGAQPTEQVAALLKLTGDWGIFKGDKNAVSTVKVKEPKPVFQIDAKKKPVLIPKAEKAPAKVEVVVEDVVAEEAAVEAVVEAVEEAVVEAAVEAVVEEVVADAVAEEAVVEAEAVAEEAAAEEKA
ncbi:MAG: small subunit ribosomal protein S16 [Alpinimonas sp.]|jgi:small subunit ribosomal protein S16